MTRWTVSGKPQIAQHIINQFANHDDVLLSADW